MLVRAGTIWLVILVLASLNGAVRDLVVAPRIGDTAARAISTLILCGLVLLVTWLSIRWVGPRSGRQALAIGLFWLVLTLAFEVGAGRLSGKAWSVVLADYDVLRGRIWVLVPIVTCLAPVWAGRVRGSGRARLRESPSNPSSRSPLPCSDSAWGLGCDRLCVGRGEQSAGPAMTSRGVEHLEGEAV